MGDSMRTIQTYGLTREQYAFVVKCAPIGSHVSIVGSDVDLIAVNSSVSIINVRFLEFDFIDNFISFYHEIDGCTPHKVIWIDINHRSRSLPENFAPYDDFEDVCEKLESILYKQIKLGLKIMDTSRRLEGLIKVLALIRKYPGISTTAIGKLLKMPLKTVQVNITTLKMAGEWIEHDAHRNGWKLFENASYFFGDCWESVPRKSLSMGHTSDR